MSSFDSMTWRPEMVPLGSGGFGQVLHYVNDADGSNIAVKQCKLGKELTDKMKDRWALEVKIMNNLKHKNIIHAIEIPKEIQLINNSGMALLGMEYCSGGDLRKVLNKPENVSGMDESIVCAVAYQIACGIEYLHSHRIFHRDIKPENIVLQPELDGSVTYKIIDLGYAKELDDSSSIATSFVGTLQYLAPELLNSKEYYNTVDYWSFGNIIFELITGTRPFLPQAQNQPYQWNLEVQKKSDKDIYATYINGKVHFGENIPKPNKLCAVMEKEFRDWLRLMLLWDKTRRGGRTPLTKVNETPKALSDLYRFLSYRVVHVLDVVNRKYSSYRVDLDEEQEKGEELPRNDSDDNRSRFLTVAELKELIYRDTHIPPSEQVLLTNPNFSPPRHIPYDDESANVVVTKTKPAVPGGIPDSSPNTVHRHSNSNDDLVFLFQTPSPDGAPYISPSEDSLPSSTSSFSSSSSPSTKSSSDILTSVVMPISVSNMIQQPRAIMRPIDQKAALGQSYCLCKALAEEHDQFWVAFRALLFKVLREHSEVNKYKRALVATAERLRFNADFYLKSLATDLNSLSRLTTSSNFTSSQKTSSPAAFSINVLGVEDALREWSRDKTEVEAFERLREVTSQIERKVETLGSKIIKIQQNPLSRQEKPDHLRAMDRLVVKALDIFTQMKKSRRDGSQPPENHEMVSVIVKIRDYEPKLAEMKGAIGQLMLCFVDMRALAPEIKTLQQKLIDMSDRLDEKQKKRQTKIWAIIEQTSRGGSGGAAATPSDVAKDDKDNDSILTMIGSLALDDMGESESLTVTADELVSGFHDVVEGISNEEDVEPERVESQEDDVRWDSIFAISSS